MWHVFRQRGLVYTWIIVLTLSDCPSILISLGLSQFCLKIPNPYQYAIGIGKVPILTRAVIFSSNSHKRKQNAEYLTLMGSDFLKKLQKLQEITEDLIGRNYCVRTPEMAFQRLYI